MNNHNPNQNLNYPNYQAKFFLANPRARILSIVFSMILLILMIISATIGKHQNLLPDLFDLLFQPNISNYIQNNIQNNQISNQVSNQVSNWLFWQLWLPRTLVAVGVGASLAISGSFFQVLSRNPLGSPDIIGINAGASAGAVAVSLIWVNIMPVTLGALLGAILSLVLVLLNNLINFIKKNNLQTHSNPNKLSFNMVIGGLAVNALAMAWVQFALTGVRQEDAYQVSVWLSGSLAQRGWDEVMIIWVVLPICGVILGLLSRPFAIIQVNQNTAGFLGISLNKMSFLGLIPATVLATAAVVCAGPIAFIALSAPHLARKLFRTNRPMIYPTALMGACLLLLADLLARFLPMQSALPVGVFTAGLGGIYLLYLIFSEKRI